MLKTIIITALFTSVSFSQKIFDSFEQDRKSKYRYTEQYTFDQVFDDGAYSFFVNDFRGDITVRGHDGSGLNVTIITTVRVLTEQRAKNIIDQNKFLVQHDIDGMAIKLIGPKEITGRMIHSVELLTPKKTNITIDAFGGDIDADYIHGQVEISTGGGNIDLQHINGKTKIETAGGDINLDHGIGKFTMMTKGGDIEIENSEGKFSVESAGGDIALSWVKGNVSLSTLGGEIGVSNFEGSYLLASSQGGDIQVRDVLGNVEMNTFGGDLSIQSLSGNAIATTSGGDIGLNKIHGNVDCSTYGGTIYGENLYGAVKALNQAGDISIDKKYDSHLKNHSIDLTSSVGDIDLTLPDDFPASFHIIHDGENASSAIESDFYFEENLSRGKINAKAIILGGIYPCKITIHHSGDIHIKKD